MNVSWYICKFIMAHTYMWTDLAVYVCVMYVIV